MPADLRERLGRVDRFAGSRLTQALSKRRVELLALVVVQVVALFDEDLVDAHELDDLALRKIGRLVEDETPL